MSGISDSLDFLITLIESVTPKRDSFHSFVCVREDIDSLDNNRHQSRIFELKLNTYGQDDGMAGVKSRKRANLSLRIRYDIGYDKNFLDRMMAEDTSYLIDALNGPDYSFDQTGIVSLILTNSSIETILNREGLPLAHILTIPFDLLYMEN